jgi:hypothetical protein
MELSLKPSHEEKHSSLSFIFSHLIHMINMYNKAQIYSDLFHMIGIDHENELIMLGTHLVVFN